jgi:hypothetical protein
VGSSVRWATGSRAATPSTAPPRRRTGRSPTTRRRGRRADERHPVELGREDNPDGTQTYYTIVRVEHGDGSMDALRTEYTTNGDIGSDEPLDDLAGVGRRDPPPPPGHGAGLETESLMDLARRTTRDRPH